MQLFIQAFCFIYLLSSCSYIPFIEPIAEEAIEVIVDVIKEESKNQ